MLYCSINPWHRLYTQTGLYWCIGGKHTLWTLEWRYYTSNCLPGRVLWQFKETHKERKCKGKSNIDRAALDHKHQCSSVRGKPLLQTTLIFQLNKSLRMAENTWSRESLKLSHYIYKQTQAVRCFCFLIFGPLHCVHNQTDNQLTED